jgi:NTE family protein
MNRIEKALVLSGGSIKGAFQAGAIAEIFNSGFVPDAIYGTSVGSLNGGFLAERAGRAGSSPNWPAIGEELVNFWQDNITSFEKIGKRRGTLKLVWTLARKKFDGFIDTTRLRKLIEREFKVDNMRKSPVAFSACAVNIADGQAVYATPQNPGILDYIIASAAIPVVMPVSVIGKQPFLDGGIREVAPLKRAIDDGANEIICIVCQAENLAGAALNHKNIIELTERLMDIVINELVADDLRRCEFINQFAGSNGRSMAKSPFKDKRFIDLTIIRPEATIALDLEKFTYDEIVNVIHAGRNTATKILEKRLAA